MKAKQYAIKQPMGHLRNQRGNQRIPGDKWKWKHNDPTCIDKIKAVLRGKFIVMQAYFRKQEKLK